MNKIKVFIILLILLFPSTIIFAQNSYQLASDIQTQYQKESNNFGINKEAYLLCIWEQLKLLTDVNTEIAILIRSSKRFCTEKEQVAKNAFLELIRLRFSRLDGKQIYWDNDTEQTWNRAMYEDIEALVIRMKALKSQKN